MTRHELASFALKLLGIYALIESLPLIQHLGGAVAMLVSDQGRDTVGFWMFVGLLIPLVLMVLSVVLFLRARGLTNLWRRLQVGKYVRVDEARP